jgi:hypothetical protein
VQWEANGVAICTAEGNQYFPTLISNGADAIITWQDWRNGNADVYAQRVNPSGIVQWGSNGAAICTTGSYQEHPSLISDCAGGAIITWQDGISVSISDIFAQRIDASGVVQWGLNGTAVSTADSGQADPDLVSDARGGAIITWLDCRNGDWDIYAQQVSANGNLGEITGVIGPGAPLSVYRLHQNYPNPFNPSTRIKFQIPSTNIVTLKIYDVSGREMITLVNIELKAGSYEATFDATRLASGVYFYRLKAGGFTETKKLLLLR